MGINYIMISDEILKSETLSVPAKFVAMIMLYVSNNNLKTNVFEKTLVERFGYSEEYYSKYLNELANHANKYITITRKFLNGKTKNSYTLNYLNPKDYKIIPFNLFNILGETADRDIMKNGKKCYKTIKFDSNAFVYYAKLKLYINSSTLERDDWRKSDIEKFLKTNKPTNNKAEPPISIRVSFIAE